MSLHTFGVILLIALVVIAELRTATVSRRRSAHKGDRPAASRRA